MNVIVKFNFVFLRILCILYYGLFVFIWLLSCMFFLVACVWLSVPVEVIA